MKAIQIRKPGGLDRFEFVDIDDAPAPGPGEIRVRLHASTLNFHDYAVVSGMLEVEDRRIPLSDCGGEVTAVGDGVREFAPGDKVVSVFFPGWQRGGPQPGGFAGVPGDGADGFAREAVTAPATAFTRAPADYSHAEAATLTCAGLTAWRALVPHGPVKAGDWVLVQGTGGVSIFALQFAKAMGARVIATSSSDEKLDRLRAMGADHVINYRKDARWGSTARKISGGGVDHVVEVGGAGTLPQSIAAAKIGGHIAMIGVLTGQTGEVPTAALMQKQIRLQGITVGSREQQLDMIAAIEATGIKPVMDRHFALKDLADAFRYEESGKHFGKIIVDLQPG